MKQVIKILQKLYAPLKNVGIFIILLFSFHYFYRWWSGPLGFFPFGEMVEVLFKWASLILFNQSVWVLEHIFSLNIYTIDQTIWVKISNALDGYVEVSPGCTSLKQWMHWIFLMVLFPGPWKHKLWYIPSGILVIHFVNLIRIVGLSLTLTRFHNHFNFFHDYIFKTFFYFMIFVMWVIWVEVFLEKKQAFSKKQYSGNIEQETKG